MGTIFSENDIRGRVGESITIEYAWNTGKAMAEWLPEQGSVIIMKGVGADAKTAEAIVEGLLLQGRDVIDHGEGDEQTMRGFLGNPDVAGGVLVAHDNLQSVEVITLFDSRGSIITFNAGLSDIEQLIEAGNFVPAGVRGEISSSQSL